MRVWLPPSYPSAGVALVAIRQPAAMRFRPLPPEQVRELNLRAAQQSVALSEVIFFFQKQKNFKKKFF